jgi:hypothetical protein
VNLRELEGNLGNGMLRGGLGRGFWGGILILGGILGGDSDFGRIPGSVSFSKEDVFTDCSGDVEIDLCIILTILFQQFLPSTSLTKERNVITLNELLFGFSVPSDSSLTIEKGMPYCRPPTIWNALKRAL